MLLVKSFSKDESPSLVSSLCVKDAALERSVGTPRSWIRTHWILDVATRKGPYKVWVPWLVTRGPVEGCAALPRPVNLGLPGIHISIGPKVQGMLSPRPVLSGRVLGPLQELFGAESRTHVAAGDSYGVK